MAKCCKCGTVAEEDFHPNTIIGFDIAAGLEREGCDYWDFKTSECLCQKCYFESIGREFDPVVWKKYLAARERNPGIW